jgi:hypothetical protein
MTALEYVDPNTYRSPTELGTPKFLIRCTLIGYKSACLLPPRSPSSCVTPVSRQISVRLRHALQVSVARKTGKDDGLHQATGSARQTRRDDIVTPPQARLITGTGEQRRASSARSFRNHNILATKLRPSATSLGSIGSPINIDGEDIPPQHTRPASTDADPDAETHLHQLPARLCTRRIAAGVTVLSGGWG